MTLSPAPKRGSSPVCGWGPGQGVPGVSDAYGGAGAAAWACSHAPGSMPHVPEERGLGTCREGVCQTWYSSWLLPARSCAGAYEDGRVCRGDVCLSVLPGRCAAPCGSPTGAGSSVLPRAPCSQQPVGSAASTRLLARRWHPHPTLTLGSQASRQPCIYGWAVTPPPPAAPRPPARQARRHQGRLLSPLCLRSLVRMAGGSFAVTFLILNRVAPGRHSPGCTLPARLSAAGSARPPARVCCQQGGRSRATRG